MQPTTRRASGPYTCLRPSWRARPWLPDRRRLGDFHFVAAFRHMVRIDRHQFTVVHARDESRKASRCRSSYNDRDLNEPAGRIAAAATDGVRHGEIADGPTRFVTTRIDRPGARAHLVIHEAAEDLDRQLVELVYRDLSSFRALL